MVKRAGQTVLTADQFAHYLALNETSKSLEPNTGSRIGLPWMKLLASPGHAKPPYHKGNSSWQNNKDIHGISKGQLNDNSIKARK